MSFHKPKNKKYTVTEVACYPDSPRIGADVNTKVSRCPSQFHGSTTVPPCPSSEGMYGYHQQQQNQQQNQQYSQYGVNASPPLHHPIPQHPIPPFRSPPPAEGAMPQNTYASQPNMAQAQAQAQGQAQGPQFNNFINEANAHIGIEMTKNAMDYGYQEYIQKNLNQYVTVSALKYYFQVSNSYVLRKLVLLLFPWRHHSWVRQLRRSEMNGAQEGYCTAKEDINAPDMYIPVMAFTTYILLTAFLAGVQGQFQATVLGYVSTTAIAFMLVELMLLKLGTYLLSAGSKILDFVAYSGYKFVGITITMLVSSLTHNNVMKWGVFSYTAFSNSFFLLRSLKHILLPEMNSAGATQTINNGRRMRRMHFLFVYSFVCQFVLMWLLIR